MAAKTEKAFLKCLMFAVIALIIGMTALFAIAGGSVSPQLSGFMTGTIGGLALIVALITYVWIKCSSKQWSNLRIGVTFFTIFIIIGILRMGHAISNAMN